MWRMHGIVAVFPNARRDQAEEKPDGQRHHGVQRNTGADGFVRGLGRVHHLHVHVLRCFSDFGFLQTTLQERVHFLERLHPPVQPTELQLHVPILAFKYSKAPQAAKAFIAFMLEKPNFDPWLIGSKGYLTHCLNAYDSNPVWTADPKNNVYSQSSKRSLPASGVGHPGERAAAAIADFLVVDMFANVCLGREDIKGAIAVCERQAKRLYRA